MRKDVSECWHCGRGLPCQDRACFTSRQAMSDQITEARERAEYDRLKRDRDRFEELHKKYGGSS